jgi:hypothetical protein
VKWHELLAGARKHLQTVKLSWVVPKFFGAVSLTGTPYCLSGVPTFKDQTAELLSVLVSKMSTYRTIAELREEATLLQLSAAEATDYVYKQQTMEHEERAKDRDLEKIREEVELQKEKYAAEERHKAREHELALLNVHTSGPSHPSVDSLSDASSKPKLPVFKAGEDVKSFIIRFERIADLLKLDRNTYTVRLGTLLSGKAVEIYASLPTEKTL